MVSPISPLTKVIQDYHLTSEEAKVVKNYVEEYATTSFIKQIGIRIFNGFKALFGKSDYQKAKMILRSHMKDELRTAFSEKEKVASPLVLSEKNRIVKKKTTDEADYVLKRLISGELFSGLVKAHHLGGYGHIMCNLFDPINDKSPTMPTLDKNKWTKDIVDKSFS